jgi:hypothetical protein
MEPEWATLTCPIPLGIGMGDVGLMPTRRKDRSPEVGPAPLRGIFDGAVGETRCSNCVECQELNAGCQGVWVRMIAFRIVSSFRIQATIATFFCLPALSKC